MGMRWHLPMAIGKNKETIDYEEFLKLAERMLASQYEEDYGSYQEVLDNHIHISERIEKEIKPIDPGSSIDLSQAKRDKIREGIEKHGNVTIGPFVLKIHRYQGGSKKAGLEKPGQFSISVYEMENKMP